MSGIPESMGKAHQHGCYRCGAKPVAVAINLLARPKGTGVSASVRQRSFCKACGDAVWDEMYERLQTRP